MLIVALYKVGMAYDIQALAANATRRLTAILLHHFDEEVFAQILDAVYFGMDFVEAADPRSIGIRFLLARIAAKHREKFYVSEELHKFDKKGSDLFFMDLKFMLETDTEEDAKFETMADYNKKRDEYEGY